MIEVVLWDCERVGFEPPLSRLRGICALGVDVVVVASGDHGTGLTAPTDGQAPGPGRIFVWSGHPPTVVEAGPSPAAVAVAPGTGAAAWVGRNLVGAGGPDAVLVVADGQAVHQVTAARSAIPAMVDDGAWRLEVGGFVPAREGDVEAWLTVGNGRTGTRGSLEEAGRASSPRVYVAGIFGCAPGDPDGPELAPGPEWTHLEPGLDGDRVDLATGDTVEHRRVLDLRQGMVFRVWRQRVGDGREWRFRSVRLASLADREVLALVAEAEVAGDGTAGAVRTAGVSLAATMPLPGRTGTVASAESRAVGDGRRVSVHAAGGGVAAFDVADTVGSGRVERLVVVSRSLDDGPGDGAGRRPATTLERVREAGMAAVQARHRRAWRDRWRGADVVVDGDSVAQEALRFAIYHLIAAADPESDAASVGARALTGPGYRGHVFWDTEVFVLPFFAWTHPPTARALLAYRYRTLPQARAKAARFGYAGALYPWESADTGEEVTPASIDLPDGTTLEILTGMQEHHISADIAWAVWQYWQITGDDEFLVSMGAEIIVETARFWASRTRVDDEGRHHIDGVIGPDEYHENVDDNAYTNVLARANLRAAAEVCALVPGIDAGAWDGLSARLGLGPGERDRWEAVAAGLVDGFDPDTGRYEQFAGFYDLEDVRAVDLAPRPFTGEMVVGVDHLRRTQVVKQADVVMLAHMSAGELPPGASRANYEYYEPRTSHGSSLSPAIHAAAAARVGAVDQAMEYFAMAAGLDLHDHMGNAAKGVHIATMGGLWQAAVFGFGGVRPGRDGFTIDPVLPPSWPRLAFPMQWRGTAIDVEVTATTLVLHLDGPASIAVGDGDPVHFGPGTFVAERGAGRWSAPVQAAG